MGKPPHPKHPQLLCLVRAARGLRPRAQGLGAGPFGSTLKRRLLLKASSPWFFTRSRSDIVLCSRCARTRCCSHDDEDVVGYSPDGELVISEVSQSSTSWPARDRVYFHVFACLKELRMIDHWENHSPNHWPMNEPRMTTHWRSHSPTHWPPSCPRSIANYRTLT